jgi:hypothetical protein
MLLKRMEVYQCVEFIGVELAAPVDRATTGPVKKATMGGSCGGEGGRRATMAGRRHNGEGGRLAAMLRRAADASRRVLARRRRGGAVERSSDVFLETAVEVESGRADRSGSLGWHRGPPTGLSG